MKKDDSLQADVRRFVEMTGMPLTELGRRAANPAGKPMSPNTIRTVMGGGAYSEDTELRLRKAIANFIVDVNAYAEDTDVDPDTVDRIARRTGRG